MIKRKYYDGHYIDSGLPLEERIEAERKAMEEDKELTEWINPDEEEQ